MELQIYNNNSNTNVLNKNITFVGTLNSDSGYFNDFNQNFIVFYVADEA